jgi:hypothetical protein
MHEARHRGVAVLGQRVLHHRRERLLLAPERDHLATDRVVRVVGVDQRDEVRRDVDPELVLRRQPLALVLGEVEDRLDLLEIVDAVAELPAPVVPLLVGDVLVDRRPPADGRATVRSESLGRVARVLPGQLGERALGFLVGNGRLDLVGVQLERPPGGVR